MVVRMSMAGLGRPQDIWHWTFRYFRAIQREYLKVVAPRPQKSDDEETVEIAPGVFKTSFDTREK